MPEVATAQPAPSSARILDRLRDGDRIAHLLTALFATLIILITVLLFFGLFHGSALARQNFGSMGFSATGAPRWSPDGKLIAFHSDLAGHGDVYVIPTTGGKPQIGR